MSDFKVVITQAGINRAVSADHAGLKAEIAYISVGTKGYTPSRSQTTLKQEVDRVEVAGGKKLGNDQWHVTGLFEGPKAYPAKEVGFHLHDGTLFALWSHPTDILFYKTAGGKVVQGFDLKMLAVPEDSITINVEGDLSLSFASEMATMATAQVDGMTRQVSLLMRVMDLEQAASGH